MNASDVTDEEIMKSILNGDETPTKPKAQNKEEGPWKNSHSSMEEQRWRRKRKNHTFNMTDKYTTFDKFKRRKDSLRLSASSIAAMAGFHPYSNLARLLMDLVYQGPVGKSLLLHDANLLGIEMISDEQAVKQIATKAGSAVKNALQQAIDISKGRQKVKSVQDADKIKADIVSMVNKSNLSIGEKKKLQEATRSGVNTGFGKEHEDNALDLYEQQCGYTVECRNEDLKCWKFQRNAADGKISPIGPPESLYQTDTVVTANSKAFFFIVGVADGIREEFYPKTDGGDDDWDLRKVVVECKHRMKSAFIPPPIYDQIQTVMYCMMYGSSEGEIIQVVRNSQQKEQKISAKAVAAIDKKTDCDETSEKMLVATKAKEDTQEAAIPKPTTSITCNRVSLNDPVMHHDQNWHETILPRLASFVDAVYSVRQNDDKRYRLIRASALASSGGDEGPYWEILFDECPWLVDCDTVFSKR